MISIKINLILVLISSSALALPSGTMYGNGVVKSGPNSVQYTKQTTRSRQNVTTGDIPVGSADRIQPSSKYDKTARSDEDGSRRNARNFLIQVGGGPAPVGIGFPFFGGPFFGGGFPGPIAPGFINNPLRFWF